MRCRLTLHQMKNNRKTILEVPVDAYQTEEFLSLIEEGLQNDGMRTIFAVNAEKIMYSRKDPELFSILKDSDFLIPDGFGPVVALRLIYGDRIGRTTGIGLMGKLLDLAERKNARVFIFGAKPDVLKTASEIIKVRYPSLDLVGTQHGYIQEEDHENLIDKINDLRTDVLFVGLGSPKQEKWISQHKKALKVKFCLGVGGSIDVFAGKVPLAPAWISRIYLEWLYRLMKEPSRIKRQKVIPIFILMILKEALFRKNR